LSLLLPPTFCLGDLPLAPRRAWEILLVVLTPNRTQAAWAPPNANLSQPYQPSAVPLQAPTMTFPPPTVPYQPPPVPFTYSAALNRYLNPNEVSGAQYSISQHQNNDQLKHMLERYQAIARSIRWNAEQLDRMIASLSGPLP